MENLSASMSSLHMEIEGTKTNMKLLERKIADISHEVSNIDQSIKTVIGLLSTNQNCQSMESGQQTPFSPYLKPHFSFSTPNSDDNVSDVVNDVVGSSTLEVPALLYKKPESPKSNDAHINRCHSNNKLGGKLNSSKSLSSSSETGRVHFDISPPETSPVQRTSPEIRLPTLEGVYKYTKGSNSQDGSLLTPERVIRHKQTKVYRRAESEPKTFNGLSEATRQKLLKEVSLDDIGGRNNNMTRGKSRQQASKESILETTDL